MSFGPGSEWEGYSPEAGEAKRMAAEDRDQIKKLTAEVAALCEEVRALKMSTAPVYRPAAQPCQFCGPGFLGNCPHGGPRSRGAHQMTLTLAGHEPVYARGEWTKDQPTEPGLYWARERCEREVRCLYVAQLSEGRLYTVSIGSEEWDDLSDFDLWLPCVVPAVPDGM